MLEVDFELAFQDVHVAAAFNAPPGFTVLYGPSGAGKTTILNCIAGTRRPDHGSIRLDGTQLFEDRRNINVPPHRRRTSRVFQEGRLFPPPSKLPCTHDICPFAPFLKLGRAESCAPGICCPRIIGVLLPGCVKVVQDLPRCLRSWRFAHAQIHDGSC